MIEDISLLTKDNTLLLGNIRNKHLKFPVEQLEDGRIIIIKMINDLKLAILVDKYSAQNIQDIRRISKALPKDLNEKMVQMNYFKYFFLFEELKIKQNVKEDNQIVPISNILRVKEKVFNEKEFFIDVVEEYSCIVDSDLNVFSCNVFGVITHKSYIGKPSELKIYFDCCENIKIFGNACILQNESDRFFHVRVGDGISELCKYVVNDVNPPIFIKKTREGYEVLPKIRLCNVNIKIPLPTTAYAVSFVTSMGRAKNMGDYINWEIPILEELGANISLKVSTLKKENLSSNIKIGFLSKNSKNTQLSIKSVKSLDTKIISYAKHELKSDNYEVRID